MNRRQFIQTATLAAATFPPGLIAAAEQSASGEAKSGGAAADSIRPDPDGMLSIRGEREFILGLYMLPKREGALREAREAGFNLVRRAATRAEYDEAQALGLLGWSALGSIPAENGAETESRIRGQIEALRDHPALLCWETEDEPTYVWGEPEKRRVSAERINATAAFIRRLDPAHPLYLNHSPTNLVSTLREYNPASDIVAMDIYPVIPHGIRPGYALWADGRQGDLLNGSLSQVGAYTDKMRAVAGDGRAVIMVLQAFAWGTLREKDRDPNMILYPSAAELRFMAWQAVARGANGLIWWGLGFEPPDAPLWDDLRGVVRELSEVREALATPAVPATRLNLKLTYRDTGHSLDRGVEWIAKPWGRDGHDMLLAAVNADGNPVDVTFEGLSGWSKCEPMFEKRDVAWSDGQLSERFEPFGVRVWRLGPT